MPTSSLRLKTRSKSPAKTPRRHASPRRHKADAPSARAVMQSNSSSPIKRRSAATKLPTKTSAKEVSTNPTTEKTDIPTNNTQAEGTNHPDNLAHDDKSPTPHPGPDQRSASPNKADSASGEGDNKAGETTGNENGSGGSGGNEGRETQQSNGGRGGRGGRGNKGGRGGRGGRGSVTGIMEQYNSLSKNIKKTKKNQKNEKNKETKEDDEAELASRMKNSSIEDENPDLDEGNTFDDDDEFANTSDEEYNPDEVEVQDMSDVEMLDNEGEYEDNNSGNLDDYEEAADGKDGDANNAEQEDGSDEGDANKEVDQDQGERMDVDSESEVEVVDKGEKDQRTEGQEEEELEEPTAEEEHTHATEEQARQRKIDERMQDAETIEKLIADVANESWAEDQAAIQSSRSSKRAAEKLPPKKGVSFKRAVCSKGVEKKDVSLQGRRLHVMIKIADPTDKSDMLNKIRDKLNELLDRVHTAMSRLSGKKELHTKQSKKYFFLREFTDKSRPSYRNRALQKWITSVTSQPSFDWFRTYFQGGMSQYQKHRGGQFYFRINAVFPSKHTVEVVLSEIRYQLDSPEERSITDILSQEITNRVKIGILVRSHGKMTQSDDLQMEIQRFAPRGVYIGLQYGNVPLPYGQQHAEKIKRVRAVIIETNEDTLEAATRFMLQLFPASRKKIIKSIFGINMVFVFSVHHPQIKELPHAVANVMTLINHHRRSDAHMHHMECPRLVPASLDYKIYSDDNETLRDRLMATKVTITQDSIGGKLFHSIVRSNYRGKYTVWFTCHDKLRSEASAVVGGIVEFIRDEVGLDVTRYFNEYDIDDDAEWDPATWTLNNEATRATDAWLVATEDLAGDDTDSDEEEDAKMEAVDEQSTALNSMDKREMDRMTGLNDEETVVNMKKKKSQAPAPKKPADSTQLMKTIEMDPTSENCSVAASSVGMGSTYSKTNQAKAELRQEMEEKMAAQEKATQERIAHLERLLAQAMGQSPPTSSTGSAPLPQSTSDPPNAATAPPPSTAPNPSQGEAQPLASNGPSSTSNATNPPPPPPSDTNGTGADPGQDP